MEKGQQRHPSPVSPASPKSTARSSETQEHHDHVKNQIASGSKVLILLRGLPGSGKSSLSKQLLAHPGGQSGCTCSADDFFLVPRGGKNQKEYCFDPLRLEDAHKHCRIQVLRAMAHGVSPIIVDNTNTQAWEMLPYVEMALEPWKAEENLRQMVANGTIAKKNICNCLGPSRNSFKGKKCNCGFIVMDPVTVPYQVELLEPLTWWYRNPSRLAKVNQHGVSQRKITQMLSHFEYGLSGKDLIKQILKKKQQRNCSVYPQPPSHPGTARIRPFKEKKTLANLAGPPLFTRPNHGNINANNLTNQFVFGSNQFQNPSTNPFPNFMCVPSVPYVQPVICPPKMFSADPGGQPGVTKGSESEIVNSRKQLHQTVKGKEVKHSSSNPKIFPGVEPSSIFSSQESSHSIDSDECSSENASTKSDAIGPNPFMKSLNAIGQDINTSNIVKGECIEISEEEERQWMQANASKYEDWKSSEEEESEDEVMESNEPKPARSRQGRRVNMEAAESIRKSLEGSDNQEAEGNEDEAEWTAAEGDHLSSWNIPSNFSKGDSQSASKDSSETKSEGPLPPRSPRRKLPIETSLLDIDDAEQLHKASDRTDPEEFSWIKDIRLLMKALGLNKDDCEANNQPSMDTESVSSVASSTLETSKKNDNMTSSSKNQDKMDSVPKQIEISKDIGSEKAVDIKTENLLQFGSAPVEILAESSGDNLPPSVVSKPSVNSPEKNLVAEPNLKPAANAVAKEGNNIDQVMDFIIANQLEAERIIKVDSLGKSGNHESVRVFDEFQVSQSELKVSDNEVEQNTPKESVLLGTRRVSSEKCENGILKTDGAEENEMQLSNVHKNDHVNNPGESNESQDKTEQVKMSVLKTLLIGLQKAQKRSPQEFESLENLPESVQIENSISPAHEMQGEESKALLLESGETHTEVKSVKDGNYNESCETMFSEAVSSPPAISTTMNAKCKELEIMGKSTEHSVHQKKLCDIDVLSSLPDSFSNEKSLIEGVVGEDPGCDNLLPFKSALPEESSSCFLLNPENSTVEKKTNDLIELNLPEQENDNKSLTVITNQDAKVHENHILSSSLDFIGKGGNFIFGLGANNEKPPTSDPTNSEMCKEVEATEVSKTDLNVSDIVAAEDFLINVSSNSMEVGFEFNCDDDSDEMYPLVLENTFVDLLYKTFGNPYEEPLHESKKLPNGSASGVKVNIPASLARKLHECVLKSQWDSILEEDEISQKMVIEDELLARQLQELENEDLKDSRDSSATPNLREIMDMEMAMAMYKADQSKNIQAHQRNDLSTQLTWDLLVKEFPQIPQNVIAQIFAAYNYSYANTREELLTSLPEYDGSANPVKDVISPEAIAAQEKALLEKAKMESKKFQHRGSLEEEESAEEDAGGVEGSWKDLVEEARKSAALNRQLQKERHAQAQAASRGGMASATAYYCQMASLHKQKAEEETRKAANILSKVFTGKYGSSEGSNAATSTLTSPPPTLDMHSMKVTEAVTVMNAFLDAHIEWLRSEKTRQPDTSRKNSPIKTKTLFLVTGRGINSLGGIPRIKPAVERQLEMRGIWYEEMNPGLLRVMISANQPTKKKV
ncbi:NEDD4-binding protein 2 [Hetaerina americana]|uniref:NEDD4-binding protein 2 n=1 Tax=Hetaerina americana TaxID=62018 RepID=UPI003A7F1726